MWYASGPPPLSTLVQPQHFSLLPPLTRLPLTPLSRSPSLLTLISRPQVRLLNTGGEGCEIEASIVPSSLRRGGRFLPNGGYAGAPDASRAPSGVTDVRGTAQRQRGEPRMLSAMRSGLALITLALAVLSWPMVAEQLPLRAVPMETQRSVGALISHLSRHAAEHAPSKPVPNEAGAGVSAGETAAQVVARMQARMSSADPSPPPMSSAATAARKVAAQAIVGATTVTERGARLVTEMARGAAQIAAEQKQLRAVEATQGSDAAAQSVPTSTAWPHA